MHVGDSLMKLLINIDVPDLDTAIAFYCTALNLKLQRVLDQDTAEISGADATIYLQRNSANCAPVRGKDIPRSYDRHWTPVHIDFVVNDLMPAVQRAIDAGAKQESECMAWYGARWITFSDPFGNGFCLLEFENGTYRPDGG